METEKKEDIVPSDIALMRFKENDFHASTPMLVSMYFKEVKWWYDYLAEVKHHRIHLREKRSTARYQSFRDIIDRINNGQTPQGKKAIQDDLYNPFTWFTEDEIGDDEDAKSVAWWIYNNLKLHWKMMSRPVPCRGAIMQMQRIKSSDKFENDFYRFLFLSATRPKKKEEANNDDGETDNLIATCEQLLHTAQEQVVQKRSQKH